MQLVEQWPIENLIEYANNPRKNDHAVDKIAAAIKEFGFRVPILAKSDGLIIDGHLRIKAARKLGMTTVPVLSADDMTDIQIKQFRLSVNKMADLAEWDQDLLKLEFEALREASADLLMTGFGEDELKKMTDPAPEFKTDPDETPDLPEKPKSETGKIYKCGKHRVMCGDSADEICFKSVLQANKPVIVFTDPPYGVAIGAKNRMLNSFQKAGRNLTDIESDQIPMEDLKKMLLGVFGNVKKVMADDCSVFVCSPQGGELGMMMMMMMMQESGLTVRHVINWVKNSPTFSMGRLDYDYQHEPILFTWGKKHKKIMGGEHKTSVWEVDKPRACKEHPTMKPVELPTNAILNHTDSGEIVFDPFLGSGTTMIAAEKTDRICCGIELMPNYVDVIRKRWAEFVHGKECDWETLTPETV